MGDYYTKSNSFVPSEFRTSAHLQAPKKKKKTKAEIEEELRRQEEEARLVEEGIKKGYNTLRIPFNIFLNMT